MNILEEYAPLYESNFSQADCYGGRAGARSYSITQHALFNLLYNADFRGFFVRQIHATIYSSMWQDLKDRIAEVEEMHGVSLDDILEVSDSKKGENYAVNKRTGASITTKGFQTADSKQTASLKSLAGATHLYIDEAEEVEKNDYRKLKLSFRKKGVKIQIVRAYNPPYVGHWLWEDYDLTKVTDAKLSQLLAEAAITLGIPAREAKEAAQSNTKTYYTAVLKKELVETGYVSINTNFLNNFENLNESNLQENIKIFREDLDYFITNILGLIANELGDVVYNDYDQLECGTSREVERGDILYVGMDFNITRMSAVIHVVDGDEELAVDEFTGVYDTYAMGSKLSEKYGDHKIIIYPDASGQNRKTSGKSDVEILEGFGFTVKARASNPPVRDRVNTFNTKLRTRKYKINRRKCPDLSEALTKLKYKNGEPDKTKGFDHVTDAAGYFVYDSAKPTTKVRGSHYG